MQQIGSTSAEGKEPRARHRDDSHRRCIVTRAVRPRTELLRFVLGPDGTVVPDAAAVLPGRGLWVSPRREVLDRAIAKNAFARAAKAPATIPPGLADQVASLLARRCLDLIGLARRAGQAVAGFEKVADAVRRGRASLLLEASDGAAGGRGKLRGMARDLPVIDLFTGAELGEAFSRDFVVHAAVEGRLAERLQTEASRLAGFRRAVRDSGAE